MTTIKLKNGSGAPAASDLVQGEPALDLTNKRLYSEDSSGNVIEVGTNPTTLTVDTDTLVVDASNNRVGVGTTSPVSPLEVKGSAPVVTANSNVFSSSGDGTGFGIYRSASGRTAGYTWSIENVISSGGSSSSDYQIDNLVFKGRASTSDSSLTERMRIDVDGNVGIGATSLSNKLTVNGNQVMLASGEMKFADAGNSLVSTIKNGGSSGTSQMQFLIGSTPAEVMRLNSAGNLLVGCTTSNGSFISGNHTQVNIQGRDDNEIGSLMVRSKGTTNATTLELAASDAAAASYVWNGSNSHLILGTNNSERIRLLATGDLCVGKSSINIGTAGFEAAQTGRTRITRDGGSVLQLNRLSSTGKIVQFHKDGTEVGSISVTNSATSYATSSDARLKENIVDAPAGSLDDIQVRSFDWKADGSHQKHGLVAQELVEVAPEAVHQGKTDDEMWSVDYSKLVPMMIKEIQDLKAEIAALKGA